MVLTDVGMARLVRGHSINALSPIAVSPSLSDTLDKFLQPLKASSPISVSVDGMDTALSVVLSRNAPGATFLTPSGIVTLSLLPVKDNRIPSPTIIKLFWVLALAAAM